MEMTTKKNKKTKSIKKPVLLTRDKALNIYEIQALEGIAKKTKWLEGVPRLIKVWPYYNENDEIEIVDVRYENEQGKKAVISFYYDGNGLRSSAAPVVLYNRNGLAKDTDSAVLIVEGAKAAEAANKLPGFVATTWNGGGKKCKQADWSILKDRKVFIYPDDDQKKNRSNELMAWYEQPGIATAFEIKEQLPNAVIVPPIEAARTLKEDGADIVEALEVMSPEEIASYILSSPPLERPIPPPASPIDTPSEKQDSGFFPFTILGVADDGKAYFLDRHERLNSFALGSITQNKLLTLAPLTFWQMEFASGKGQVMQRDDWTAAIDSIIQATGLVDFNPDRIRGRGAWRNRDGKLCYHDGLNTIGEPGQDELYLRMTRKDIGLDSNPPDKVSIITLVDLMAKLSFETRADMIRCLAWATLAPFAGALPWRPAGLLTGRSESGKSTIVDMIIKPLSLPFVFSGGETTEAGVRQTIKNDATAIVIEESETDTPKKKQRRDDVLSLMRQSTSDETPKAAKGTIDGKGMMFTLRSMFMFVAISPEVESVADDTRIFRINLERNDNDWAKLKKQLAQILTPEFCSGIRALTWEKLQEIFELADRMAPVIQQQTGKSARFATAESILFASYQIIWKQNELTEEEIITFFNQIYDWQPPDETRDETEELFDRLLDEIIQEGKDKYTLRQVLQKCNLITSDDSFWRGVAGRYGMGLTPDGDLAIAKNHHAISRIIERGRGYQRIFFRHPKLKERSRSVGIGGKVRNCFVLDRSIIADETEKEEIL
jgi:hypothetical protein